MNDAVNYYKATIQYDGSDHFGFQWQLGIPTLQNDFNLSIQQLVGGKITSMGASRTDTGVHAFHQVVKVTSANPIDRENFKTELNQVLPQQIRCLDFAPCASSFKPVSDSKLKEYRYFFTNTLKSECNEQKFIANNPFKLDIEAMKYCAGKIVGKHDFKNFCSMGSNVKTTIREITFCELTEVNPHIIFRDSSLFHIDENLTSCYQLRIEASGFLKQMIRHLMSALWRVGSGKFTTDEFELLLNGPLKEKRLWKVADPRGLYLYKITY
jgi:tRNA pseudouridine38-40 synthase